MLVTKAASTSTVLAKEATSNTWLPTWAWIADQLERGHRTDTAHCRRG